MASFLYHRLVLLASGREIVGILVSLVAFPVSWGLFATDLPSMREFILGGQSQYWWLFYGYLLVLEWLVFAVVVFALRRSGGLDSIGFPLHWRRWQIALVVVLAVLFTAGAIIVGLTPNLPRPVTFYLPSTLTERVATVLVFAPTAAIVEETVFRGFALSRLPRLLGGQTWLAWIVAGLLFAFMHGDWRAPLPVGAINFGWRFAFAIIAAALYTWRHSLALPMVLHWLIDAFGALAP